MSTCSSCNAPVVWAITEANGKRIPLDAEPNGELTRVTDGNLVLTGDYIKGTPAVRYSKDGGTLRSHFVTCAHPKEHRK